MGVCNCSLAGTKACLTCNNNNWSTSTPINIPIVYTNFETIKKRITKRYENDKLVEEIIEEI